MKTNSSASTALKLIRRPLHLLVVGAMALAVTFLAPVQALAASKSQGATKSEKSIKEENRNAEKERKFRVDDDDHNDNEHHFGHHKGKHVHKNGAGHDETCGGDGDDSGGGGGGGEVLVPVDVENTSGTLLVISNGDSITLTAELLAGSGPVTYQWMKRLTSGAYVTIDGATSLTLDISNASSEDNGEYWIVASNSLGSDTSTRTQVLVPAVIEILNTTTSGPGVQLNVTRGSSFTLSAQLIAGSAPIEYQWMMRFGSNEPVAIPGATSLTYVVQNALPENTGQYWIVASNSEGIAVSHETQVSVLSIPRE